MKRRSSTTILAKQLSEVGACFAVSTGKYLCNNHMCCNNLNGDRPAYHVLPNEDNPRLDTVVKFSSLASLRQWIKNGKRWDH